MGLPARASPVPVPGSSFLLVVFVALAAFWRCLSLPFVQDDWVWIETFQRNDLSTLIAFIFDTHYLFYRPLAQLYLLAQYILFGENALPSHIVALLIHVFNSCLVIAIFGFLTKDRLIGTLTGLIYAVAVSIHLDTLSWMVGIYDLGAAFFFFVAIWLFTKNYYWSSVSSFLMAALFKESVIILPLILVGLEFFIREKRSYYILKEMALRLFPYWAISGLILLIKLKSSEFSVTHSSEHPYALEFLDAHVAVNLYQYLGWMAQSLIPVDSRLPILSIVVLLFVAIKLKLTKKWQTASEPPLLSLCIFWVLICLLPILFLSNHSYRYYAVYALPAFVCAVLLVLRGVLESLEITLSKINKIVLVCAVSVIVSSILQSNRIFDQGLQHKLFSGGTNQLIKRAASVEITRKFLLAHLPALPDTATLVFDGLDVWAFNKDAGPRVWYNNKTLKVYEFRDLAYRSGVWSIRNPPPNQVQDHAGHAQKTPTIDPETLYAFRLRGNELQRISIDELKVIVAPGAGSPAGLMERCCDRNRLAGANAFVAQSSRQILASREQ